jgi:hypothetical protein
MERTRGGIDHLHLCINVPECTMIAAGELDDSKELRNRFNFSERAAQTSALHPKHKHTGTEPPPTIEISGTCCQSVIYDEYVQDQERIEAQERAAKAKAAAKKVCWHLSQPARVCTRSLIQC